MKINTFKPVVKKIAVVCYLALIATSSAQAGSGKLEEAANRAVIANPEVLNKWHQFRASVFERDTVWGRNLPTIDVLFGSAHQRRESPLYIPSGSERTYTTDTTKISLRQNLFEGFATENDTRRLEHASLVRFYEMLELSESAAFEAARAYADILRYRKLLEFAQENYATHRVVFDKIKERAGSGVGRKVDLETAAGRLALAESNLLTETSNLHDVTARFQRITGDLPAQELDPLPSHLLAALPKSKAEALVSGFEKAPQLKASFENILSAKRNIEVQKAGNYPRIDLYAEKSLDKNADGYTGNTKLDTYGVTVSWNLFRGFQDQNRTRKAAEELNGAKDQREKVCRDLRQNLSMSINEYQRLTEQLQYLDQHQLSTDKAREAFRRQFDIGQRTLLDLLDTENEFYTARRNYVNGEHDQFISGLKYLAASGALLNTLKLKNLEMEPPKPITQIDSDWTTTCPHETIAVETTDKEAIFKKALAKADLLRISQPALPDTVPGSPPKPVEVAPPLSTKSNTKPITK